MSLKQQLKKIRFLIAAKQGFTRIYKDLQGFTKNQRLINIENRCKKLSKKTKKAYKKLFKVQWSEGSTPEFFDHTIDLHYGWETNQNSLWLERGVYSSLAIKRMGKILEIACGDGFNAKYFYSHLAENIIACDFDKNAIKTATEKNQVKNVQFVLADIRTNMPKGKFDNIIWDAAIEHFTPQEINQIMQEIKTRLTDSGILSGYTIVEKSNGKQLEQHEYEFKSKKDCKRFFIPYFKNVTVFETIFPERHNLYFWASDGVIPFSKNWDNMI